MSILLRGLKIVGVTLVIAIAVLWPMDRFKNKVPEELRGTNDLERTTIDATIKQLVADLEEGYKGKPGPVRRDAHAKSHGCLKANFKVAEGLPENLKVGMFANEGGEHKAWVRFSNGAFTPRHDIKFDGRGLSLKILDTSPETSASDGESVAQHDLLLVNHPVFFSPDPVDYYAFVKAGVLVGRPGALKRYFMPGYNPFGWRLKEFVIAHENSSREIKTPLDMQYFSMSPYAYGDQQVKYTAKRCEGNSNPFSAEIDENDPDYLRKNLKKHLDVAPACFALSVQVNDGSVSVEDASADWSENKMPFNKIGYINIPQQDFANPHNDHFCEHSDFNPGRTSAGFEPLGGINRLRKEVYSAISEFRHKRNSTPVSDPNLAWDQN